jgi:hypothetical protein
VWLYHQTTGALWHDALFVDTGYSGHGPGKDCPADQSIPFVGPIPRGLWHIGPARTDPHLGALAMPLTPDPTTNLSSRFGFWMHGDSITHPGQGSDGCLCLSRPARAAVALSQDTLLTVTS